MARSMGVTASQIVNDLTQHNVCKYCCLRYVNEKSVKSYGDADKYMKELFGTNYDEDYAPIAKQKKSNPCSACLGLLQISGTEDFLENIKTQVLAEGYESEDVTFALSLPITILLRDYAVWLYISRKYPDYFADLFTSLPLKRSSNTVAVKEAWKLIAGQKLAAKLNKTLNNGLHGSFHVNIHIEYDADATETNCLIDMLPDIFRERTTQRQKFHGEILTRKSVENSLPQIDYDVFKTFYPVPPDVPNSFVKCGAVECYKDSIFLAGRYNKYSRNLSQTPWIINGERKMESSVEEKIGEPISLRIKHGGIKFSSSGREDVDVRTLGKGRPFILEITNPRVSKLDFNIVKQLQDDINKSTPDISVRDLQTVQKSDLAHIKLGEQNKTKTYTCFCLAKIAPGDSATEFVSHIGQLNKIKYLIINQKTPIRVLHRRSLAVRRRIVFWMEAKFHEKKDNQVYFKLALQVEAGTYVKEFIHGDFGRTKPNLSGILEKEVDILALDVEEVALQWPPTIEIAEI